jgi:hypothetical protein
MLSGLMLLVLIRLRLPFRRLWSCPQGSLNFLLVRGNPGEVSYSMDPQVLVSLISPRLVLLRQMVPSLVSQVLISSANGLESPRDLWSNFLSLPEKTNPPSYSLMKSIHSVAAEVKVKMRLPEELRLSFWFRCRVLVMIMMVF